MLKVDVNSSDNNGQRSDAEPIGRIEYFVDCGKPLDSHWNLAPNDEYSKLTEFENKLICYMYNERERPPRDKIPYSNQFEWMFELFRVWSGRNLFRQNFWTEIVRLAKAGMFRPERAAENALTADQQEVLENILDEAIDRGETIFCRVRNLGDGSFERC